MSLSNAILLSDDPTYYPGTKVGRMIWDLDESRAERRVLHNTRTQRAWEEREETEPPRALTSLWSTRSLVNTKASLLKGSAV